MKPLIVAVAGLSPWLTRSLEADYRVLWLHKAADRAAALSEVADEAEVVVTTGIHGTDNALLDALPRLKLVAVHGVGYDKVDVGHARALGVSVTNTPDVLTEDVADMALALILATARRIAFNDRYVREGKWGSAPIPPLGRKVTGARFGILGLGRIGSAIAHRLEGFSPHIAYHNRSPVAGCSYHYCDSADALARESDFLIVATSGGAESVGLINVAILDALGPEGVLINIGRGSTVNESALVAALMEGRIAGAGLDVFANEPHVPDALHTLDQVVLQPHQASATAQTRIAMAELVMSNISAHFAHKSLPTAVA